MVDTFIHTSNGELLSPFDIPGTKVKRKEDLPFRVNPDFPAGEVKVITKPCGKVNRHQDPLRPVAHVWVEADSSRWIAVGYCFHPYADTLEVVDESKGIRTKA